MTYWTAKMLFTSAISIPLDKSSTFRTILHTQIIVTMTSKTLELCRNSFIIYNISLRQPFK